MFSTPRGRLPTTPGGAVGAVVALRFRELERDVTRPKAGRCRAETSKIPNEAQQYINKIDAFERAPKFGTCATYCGAESENT